MKQIVVLVSLVFIALSTRSQQRLLTRSGFISFYSDAPLEKIEANTRTAASVLDKKTGQVEFSVLIKSFSFRKALMQEHFNENYLESDKYPEAKFEGKIIEEIDLHRDGLYNIRAKGNLSIHGVTQERIIKCVLTIKNGVVNVRANFIVLLVDHNIAIPTILSQKLASDIKVEVKSELAEK